MTNETFHTPDIPNFIGNIPCYGMMSLVGLIAECYLNQESIA